MPHMAWHRTAEPESDSDDTWPVNRALPASLGASQHRRVVDLFTPDGALPVQLVPRAVPWPQCDPLLLATLRRRLLSALAAHTKII